ncbi:unnamed protein product [Somion occarium]|uniref:Uncharacterized protein n=1 Tax=Somion occarium TaxID=3059160 RepID=A0ABP1CZ72_9APHY
MSYDIAVISFSPGGLFKAHWALYAIETNGNSTENWLIHVEGEPSSGFTHDIKKYDIAFSRRSHHVHSLLGGAHITASQLKGILDVATSIPAPGKSLRSASSAGRPQGRVRLENCQTWLTQVVEGSIQQNYLPPEALTALHQVPMN